MDSNRRSLGLNFLINFHKWCGISYFGHSIGRQWMPTRIASIVWNAILLLNICYHIYWAEIYPRVGRLNSYLPMGSVGLQVLSSISTTNYLFIGYLHALVLLKSRPILEIMQRKDKVWYSWAEDQNEVTIGKRVALIHCLYIAFSATLYFTFYFLKNGLTFSYFLIVLLLKTLFLRSNESAMISLVAYKSLVIESQLKSLSANTSFLRIEIYCRVLLEVRSQMQQLDKALSSGFLVLISLCIQNQIVGCVFLCIAFKSSHFHIIPHISVNIVLLIVLCFVSNIIHNSMTRFHDSIVSTTVSQYFQNNDLNPNQRQKLSNVTLWQIVSPLRSELHFSALGLYSIRSDSLLAIVSVIISYAVIMVQTSSQLND